MAADGTAAGQTRNGLRDDGLEDRRGDVFLGGAFVEQGLYIGLGEHAAAARDRVDDLVVAGELVQAGRVGVEQGGHLVDEGARAAGALAVHALLDVAVEVDDLGVLAAELDGDVGFGDEGLDRRLVGDDLLHEGNAEPLAEQKSARAGDGAGHFIVAELFGRPAQDVDDRGAHVGMVALVDGVVHRLRVVQDRELDRGRTHVDAQMQAALDGRRRCVGSARALYFFTHGCHAFLASARARWIRRV